MQNTLTATEVEIERLNGVVAVSGAQVDTFTKDIGDADRAQSVLKAEIQDMQSSMAGVVTPHLHLPHQCSLLTTY